MNAEERAQALLQEVDDCRFEKSHRNCDSATVHILAYRREALEEAAKAADDHIDNVCDNDVSCTSIPEDIRDLIEREKEKP